MIGEFELAVSRASASSALVVLALAGCDPGVDIAGTVHDRTGTPVPSATVSLSCPSGTRLPQVHDVMTTGEDGTFHTHGLGCLQRDCTLTATLPTGGSSTITVGDACDDYHWYCKSGACC